MYGLQVEELLIIGCGIIILSICFPLQAGMYEFPPCLMLLFAGIALRAIADANDFKTAASSKMIEGLGVIGLIMIILEAGLDLRISKNKLALIRDSFFSALVIFVISAAILTTILTKWLHEPIEKCLVYAIPLSIMSSTIVIPSINLYLHKKKSFLPMKPRSLTY
jgi:Kef-type K+ transport system membrane component KefB